ncbi:uncharacterized protein N7503_000488 [Penicillium pulvis]|uniref:uncharacterized protein n=1 Tax=Penicillium pulvis TaxID=1562058 RepID=UPI00254847FE|nr:uncharacterized protein N7503_000488 [Penicillium pulvis]KAJ5813738.1 hypothetical protein N7503_000488 [Penicillium pulvis]
MPTPPSSANLNGGIMPSGTDDLRKRNDSEIMSEKQNRTISQEASHVRLEAITINQVVTKQHAPSALNSDKTPAKSISRRRDEASAKLVKIQTRLDPTTIDISSSNTGRKPYKRTHLGQTTEETSRAMALTPSSPMDVSLLSVSFRLSKVKRFRQTSCVLWRLPNISEINTEFSDRKNILLAPKPRRVMASKQGLGPEQASRPQSITTDGSEQPQPAGNRTAETFLECKRISSPHTGTKQKANQDDFPWVALERRSFCGALKEVGAVPKSLLKIMPLELLQLLEEDGRRCTARTTQGNRCKLNHPIGSMSAQLQSLASLKPGALLPVIQNLIEVVFCAIHQKVALKETILWKEEFEEVSKIQDYESMITIENKRLWALLRWGCLLKQEALSQPISTSLLQHTVEKETLPINPIQEFKHYVSKRLSGTISEELAMLLTRPLTQSDLKHQGSMYIFWQPRNFGHLKIGGSVNVPCRLDQWNKQCKKTMETIFPENVKEEDDKTVDSQQVPHISRVEALVHLELLRHRRIEKKCPGCLKSHVEWFEIPKDIAIGVVRKWSTWMLTLPYEKQMRDGKEQWILKSTERENLANLCRTDTKPSTPSLPPVKEKRRSSPRFRRSI